MPYGLSKFCRFAVNVWEVNPAGKADEQVAREGLSCMEVWMKELGLTMNLHELGQQKKCCMVLQMEPSSWKVDIRS